MTPKQSIEIECGRRGRGEVVAGCIDLVEGRPVDDQLILALAGPAALPVLRGQAGGRGGYWPRVWGARGLLHIWDDRATRAIVQGAVDDSWRVREMICKVAAAHHVVDALGAVEELRNDPIPRVCAAANRAVVRLTD